MSKSRILSLVLCLLMAYPLLGSTLIDPDQTLDDGTVYKTAVVTLGDYEKMQSGSCYMYFPIEYNIRCKVRNARISSININRRSDPKEGDLLGTFTSENSHADMEAIRLELMRTEESCANKKADLQEAIDEKRLTLGASGDSYDREIAALELQKMQLEYDNYCLTQERTIANLRTKLAALEDQLAETPVYSPTSGAITAYSYLNEGDSIAYNQLLVSIRDDSVYLLKIEDPQMRWRYGMAVTITYGTRSNRLTTTGHVVSADNVRSFDESDGYAYIALDKFIPSADVNNATASGQLVFLSDVLLVKKNAAVLNHGKYVVSILNGNSIAKRYVNIGMNTAEYNLILQGLTEGQVLVLD